MAREEEPNERARGARSRGLTSLHFPCHTATTEITKEDQGEEQEQGITTEEEATIVEHQQVTTTLTNPLPPARATTTTATATATMTGRGIVGEEEEQGGTMIREEEGTAGMSMIGGAEGETGRGREGMAGMRGGGVGVGVRLGGEEGRTRGMVGRVEVRFYVLSALILGARAATMGLAVAETRLVLTLFFKQTCLISLTPADYRRSRSPPPPRRDRSPSPVSRSSKRRDDNDDDNRVPAPRGQKDRSVSATPVTADDAADVDAEAMARMMGFSGFDTTAVSLSLSRPFLNLALKGADDDAVCTCCASFVFAAKTRSR